MDREQVRMLGENAGNLQGNRVEEQIAPGGRNEANQVSRKKVYKYLRREEATETNDDCGQNGPAEALEYDQAIEEAIHSIEND